MSKQTVDKSKADMPLDALMLECNKDRYKVAYAAIRWARELKIKENLAESIPHIVPRALRDILTGKVSFKDVEKLPMLAKPQAPAPAPSAPTITLNPAAVEDSSKED